MDLQQFCYRHTGFEIEDRKVFCAPFSIGEWTYATNGYVAIRIPRISDAAEMPPDNKYFRDAPKLFDGIPENGWIALPRLELPPLPPEEEGDCESCDGRGTQHDCPGCDCECKDCGDTGSIPRDRKVSVGIGKEVFSAKLILMIQSLPHVSITDSCKEVGTKEAKAAFFRFDGGEGLIMPRTKPDELHIDLNAKAA